MKKALAGLIAASALVAVAAPASAQYAGWTNINQRQAALERRINQGVRSGQLTRVEAARLRGEFRSIARLEARYRYTGGGLNAWERRDLDRRFDILAVKIRLERSDWDRRQYRGYRR